MFYKAGCKQNIYTTCWLKMIANTKEASVWKCNEKVFSKTWLLEMPQKGRKQVYELLHNGWTYVPSSLCCITAHIELGM